MRRHGRRRYGLVRKIWRWLQPLKLIWTVVVCLLVVLLTGEIGLIVTGEEGATQERQWAEWERRLYDPLEEAQLEAIEAAARGLLSERPLDGRALRLLALAADQRGDGARAGRLMQLAVERSQADVAAHAWLLDHRLADGDIGGSLIHLDAALRANPRLLPAFFPTLQALLSLEGGTEALADLLAADPPWRGLALNAMAREPADPRVVLALFKALLKSSRSPIPSELNPYLDRLVRDGYFRPAHALWLQWLPQDRRIGRKGLVNGDFEDTPTGAPFDWQLDSVRGARIRISEAQHASGRMSLEIEFLDARVTFRHVRQLLLLEPGAYRLTGKYLTKALHTERGLRWRMACVGQGGQALGASEPLLDGSGWREFSLAFDVPDEGCAAQWLILELFARIASEQQIAGQIWLDALRIVPEGTVRPTAAD